MKRFNFLYEQIVSIENLELADEKAQKGKKKQYGVKLHNKKKKQDIIDLHNSLVNNSYKTSEYKTFTIFEPKERKIFKLPFYPDRILHHGIMNILEPIFVSTFTKNSYSCIKGKGIHAAFRDLKTALKDVDNTTYCLKLDIVKFYPNINHDILKHLLRKKFKDVKLLNLLYEIIDSADGLPIGNYLSQFLANFYLTYFDHWLKEEKNVKHYFRYADDIVILSNDKAYLHKLLFDIKTYLSDNLDLKVKSNYQIFPVASRGIDFVGYVFYHTHILLRKTIKKNFARKIKNNCKQTLASYYSWAKHCNSKNLLKKLIKNRIK